MLKILQARLQQYMSHELPDVQTGFRKGRGTRDQIANIIWIINKAREFQKKKRKKKSTALCQSLWIYSVQFSSVQFSSVQSLIRVWLFATPWISAHQTSLPITNSWSLLKLLSIESVKPSNHLILCCPLLFLPSILCSIRVFSNELVLYIRWPKY